AKAARTASAPFDDLDSGLIVRTCDHVDFYVHGVLLSLCSTVFRDWLRQPYSPDTGSLVYTTDETSESIDNILRFCYPFLDRPSDVLGDLDILITTFEAARRLGFQLLVDRELRPALMRHVVTAPERIYALAWAHEMGDLARTAARATLDDPFVHCVELPEFGRIDGNKIIRLLVYQHACIAAA
ncbi:hypothetical protein K488DRAFT_33032, partial [Vararia minispora EC-137]